MTGRVRLTERQREILSLLADGCSTPQVCTRMHLAETTVKSHLKLAFAVLGAASRTHAVAIALRSGLIPGLAEEPGHREEPPIDPAANPDDPFRFALGAGPNRTYPRTAKTQES